MRDVKCPGCRNKTNELMSCDSCSLIGCIRCIVKHSKQWLCTACKKANSSYAALSQPAGATSSPSTGFPSWFG